VTNFRRVFAVAAVVIAGLATQVVPASAVVGGEQAASGQFPSTVEITYQTLAGKKHGCGGVLRDSNTVVTTAGCVDGHTANELFVHLGGTDRTKLDQQLGVSVVLKHPQYDPATGRSNIALLKLATRAVLSDTVKSAPFVAPEFDDPAPGTRVQFAGWGKTHAEDTNLPTQLQYADVPVIGRAACNTAYGAGSITNGMFCTKAQLPKFACDGDAGSPVFVDGAVVGFVTAKNRCTHPGKPDVFVRLGAFRDWASQSI